MKKRTGVERAVIVMAVVVVLLAIALIVVNAAGKLTSFKACLLYTSPSPRD